MNFSSTENIFVLGQRLPDLFAAWKQVTKRRRNAQGAAIITKGRIDRLNTKEHYFAWKAIIEDILDKYNKASAISDRRCVQKTFSNWSTTAHKMHGIRIKFGSLMTGSRKN